MPILLGLALAGGCGTQPPRPPDLDVAREALEATLTAWQEGKAPESLRHRQPPIEVSDHQWAEGKRLVKYRIEGQDRPSGADHVFRVILWIDTGRKKPSEELTEYSVGTDPGVRVIRSGL